MTVCRLLKPACCALFLCALSLFIQSGTAQGQQPEIKVADPFKITRIYTDKDGVSHFGSTEVTFELADFAPPALPISVAQAMNVESVTIISSPVGWHGDWHPSPVRQIIICLAGELEVEVSDGEVRIFGPGSVTLVEDTEGKGHISRVVGTERAFMASIPMKVEAE
jgi:quercetin dioxygenase-like cupin family protein